jgi:hypothetical protein
MRKTARVEQHEAALEADGYRMALEARGQAWAWRLTTPEGVSAAGLAPDRTSARRSAAFAAFALGSLSRIRSRNA